MQSVTLLMVTERDEICFEKVQLGNDDFLRLPFLPVDDEDHEHQLIQLLPDSYIKALQTHVEPFGECISTKVYTHEHYDDSAELYCKIPVQLIKNNTKWYDTHVIDGNLVTISTYKVLKHFITLQLF